MVSSFVFCDYKDEPGRSDQQIFIPTANVRVQSSTPESNPEIKKSATQVMLSGAVTLEWNNCRMEADDYGKLLYLSGHIYIFRKLYDSGKCYLLWRLSQNCERVHVYITVKKRHRVLWLSSKCNNWTQVAVEWWSKTWFHKNSDAHDVFWSEVCDKYTLGYKLLVKVGHV